MAGLGIAEERRDTLAASVDIILHNGALLNMLAPYPVLRGANTLSVIPLLELMIKGRPKALHFVSTLAVTGEDAEAAQMPRPATELRAPGTEGYALSKWVAEKMLEAARAKGFNIAIYRPGAVLGDSITGAYPAVDATNSFFRLCHDLRAVPALLDLFPWQISFVDRAARQIAAALDLDHADGHIAHVYERDYIDSNSLAQAFAAAGCDVAIVSPARWSKRVRAFLAEHPDHMAGWLAPTVDAFEVPDANDVPDAVSEDVAVCAVQTNEDFDRAFRASISWLVRTWTADTQNTGTE